MKKDRKIIDIQKNKTKEQIQRGNSNDTWETQDIQQTFFY